MLAARGSTSYTSMKLSCEAAARSDPSGLNLTSSMSWRGRGGDDDDDDDDDDGDDDDDDDDGGLQSDHWLACSKHF